jgi:hypothetical protein
MNIDRVKGVTPDVSKRILRSSPVFKGFEKQGRRLEILEVLGGGRSGALVLSVNVNAEGLIPENAVLKLDRIREGSRTEAERNQEAAKSSPEFFKNHIASLKGSPVETDEGVGMLFELAGGNETEVYTLSHYSKKVKLVELKSALPVISSDLLADWNLEKIRKSETSDPWDILWSWLGSRTSTESLGETEASLGIHHRSQYVLRGVARPNPARYIDQKLWENVSLISAIRGNFHGDLNTRNILCKQGSPNNYWLIDLSHYQPNQFLLFDNAYLELTYILDQMELTNAKLEEMINLVLIITEDHIPTIENTGLPQWANAVVETRKKLSHTFNERFGSMAKHLWAQFWLGGMASGINLMGKVDSFGMKYVALVYASRSLERFALLKDFGLKRDARPPTLEMIRPFINAGSESNVRSKRRVFTIRGPKPTTMPFSSTSNEIRDILQKIGENVEQRHPGLTQTEQLREVQRVYREASPQEHADTESGEAFAGMLYRGLKARMPILTMWTLGFGERDVLLARYTTNVLPEEFNAVRSGVRVSRIVAHMSLKDILRYIALQANTFREVRPDSSGKIKYQLFLPVVDATQRDLERLLRSNDLCPKVEIVVIGEEQASIDFPHQEGATRVHVETSDRKMIKGVYQELFKWFTRNRELGIESKVELESWLQDLKDAIKAVEDKNKPLDERTRLEIDSSNNIIDAILETLGEDIGLKEKWWNETSPIYKSRFTSVENPFLQAFFLEEVAALRSVLQRATSSDVPPVYIEVGSGTGRTFEDLLVKRFADRSHNYSPVDALVGIDFASQMVTQCRESLVHSQSLDGKWKVPWVLVCKDARNLDLILDKRNRNLFSDVAVDGDLDGVNKALQSRPWVIGLTSVLPNMSPTDREAILESLKRTLGPEDLIFASSYSADHFAKVAYDLYTNKDVAKISGKTVITYDTVRHVYSSIVEETKGRFFTTRWFSEDDLISEFQRAHLRVHRLNLERKPPRVQDMETTEKEKHSDLERHPYPRGAFVWGTADN